MGAKTAFKKLKPTLTCRFIKVLRFLWLNASSASAARTLRCSAVMPLRVSSALPTTLSPLLAAAPALGCAPAGVTTLRTSPATANSMLGVRIGHDS